MSNPENHNKVNKNGGPNEQQSWRQRYGAGLLLAGFALLIVVMVVMQKRTVQ